MTVNIFKNGKLFQCYNIFNCNSRKELIDHLKKQHYNSAYYMQDIYCGFRINDNTETMIIVY